jgi:hypothetical protein
VLLLAYSLLGSSYFPMCSGLGYLHPLPNAAMWIRRGTFLFGMEEV